MPVPADEEALMTKISLVRTTDRAEGVKRVVTLLQPNLVGGTSVTLKLNFNPADAAPGSMHNDTLNALVLTLQEMGATRITLAERSGPGDSTRQVMEKKGIFGLAQKLGFNIVNLEELGPEGWVHLHPKDSHWENGFHFPRVYIEAESIVQTCCLKTHAFGGHFTLSLKCSVGMVPRIGYQYMRELHTSQYQRQMIAERKSFLRSFIKRIEINRNEVVVHYHLPLPQNEKGERVREVLPMVTPGGAGGIRTPYLLTASQTFSQLNYSPMLLNTI